MKLTNFLLITAPAMTLSWTPNAPTVFVQRTAFSSSKLQVSNADDSFIRNSQAVGDKTDQPCWQDIWSYDCAMSNAYSAAFVPAEWIKKLPCALGLADCDTPESLKRPVTAAGSGVEQVDVMSFLKITRADPVKKRQQ